MVSFLKNCGEEIIQTRTPVRSPICLSFNFMRSFKTHAMGKGVHTFHLGRGELIFEYLANEIKVLYKIMFYLGEKYSLL